MKTKRFIELLQEADPTGEAECCIGNADIYAVEPMPAYYDGALQVLIRDESCPYFNVVGAKYQRTGTKINVHPLSITDVLCDKPDIPVDYSELNEQQASATKAAHDNLRRWHKNMLNGIEQDLFVEWFRIRGGGLTADLDGLEDTAKAFFQRQGIRHDFPLPSGGVRPGTSYRDLRHEQWDSMFRAHVNDGFLEIEELLSETVKGG